VARPIGKDPSDDDARPSLSSASLRPVALGRADAARDVPRRGADGIKDDLARQLTLMANRAASYRKLVPLLVQLLDDPHLGPALFSAMQRAWRSREFLAFYERPLLLFAALRADALADGASHPLHAALRDDAPNPDAMTEAALREAISPSQTGLWTSLGLRRVQTNETSRALAWLWPAALAGCSGGARPVLLVDVGCSAGLNLIGDLLPYVWTAAGAPLSVVQRPKVVGRFGLDERPLDVTRADDARWLRACIWPGETQRLERLDKALAGLRAARDRGQQVEVVRRDATGAPAYARNAVASAPPNTLTIVYQTMMSGYLDAASRAAFEDGLHQLLMSSPQGAVLWVDLEVTGPATSPRPAELWVHARNGDQRVDLMLGTTGYHPADVSARRDAVRDLTRILQG
jgi:hypothetical protein